MAAPQVIENSAARPQYAGLGARLGAYLLDFGVALAVLMAASLTMRSLRAFGLWTPAPLDPVEAWRSMELNKKLLVVIAFIVASGPFQGILLQSSPWQASVGKRLLSIYVTDGAGRRITLARSCARWISRWILSLLGAWPLSLLTIGATPKKKALHDYVVNTLVFRGRPVPEASLEPWHLPIAFALPFFWLVVTFLITM